MDEDLLRKLWEVSIPGAEFDGELDPGETYRPEASDGESTSPPLPTLWVTHLGLELRDVEDSQAAERETTRDDPLSDSEMAPTIEGSDSPSAFEATQDPEAAATIYEPPPVDAANPLTTAEPVEASAATGDGLVYELKEVIGQGGMGVVYRARQSSLQRDVAVKTMQARRSGRRWRDRFVAEAVVTGQLDHPNIVPVYDLGQAPGGEALLSMKLVEGISWKRLLRPKTDAEQARAADLDVEDHLRILISVCNAVAFAHSRGLVHNDLKPDNVMIGDYGEVLVMDWGLAVDVGEHAEPTSGVQHKSAIKAPCGTPSYMAPELAEGHGQSIGPWTDVYLLGAILYELNAGRPPHRGKTFGEVVMSAVLSRPKPFPAGVPLELQTICHTAMARDPSDRYPNAVALREAIEAHLEHRESVQVSERVREQLAGCLRRAAAGTDRAQRDALYDEFAGVVAGFQQALMLWEGNGDAQAGVEEARLAYADEALRQGDLGLAAAQLARAADSPERRALHERVERTRERHEAEARRARQTRLGLIAAVVAVFAAISVGFVLVRSERDQAERERRDAVEARARAAWEADQAERAREAAEGATRAAQGRLARSLTAEGSAMVRAGRGRAARERFVQAREIQQALGEPTLPAELGLWSVQRSSRAPLFTLALDAAPAGLAFTADGRLVAADAAGRIRVYDRSTGRELLAREAGEPLTCLATSPRDADLIAAGTAGGDLLLWDLDRERPERLAGHRAAVTALRFSREGTRLLSGDRRGVLLRFEVDPALRGLPYIVYSGHTQALRGLDTFQFNMLRRRHDTANHALAIDAGGRLNWFYLQPQGGLPPTRLGRVYGVSPPRNLEHELGGGLDARCLAITFDFPQRVAIGGGDHTVRVALYTEHGWTFGEPLRGHSAPVHAVAWSPDGRHLVSGGLDDRVIVWDAETGRQVLVTRDHDRGVAQLAISRRGDRVVAAGRDGTLRVWDLGLASGAPTGAAAGRELRPLPLTYPGTAAALSPDGSLAVVAEHGFPPQPPRGEPVPAEVPLTVWDAETGRALATLHGHAQPVREVAFLSAGAELLSADAGGTVRLWSIDDAFQLPRRTLETGLVDMQAAVVPGGQRLLLGDGAGRVELRDLGAAEAPVTWTPPRAPAAVTALAAGRAHALVGTADGDYARWAYDAEAPTATGSLGAAVTAAAITADGATYAVGTAEGRMLLARVGEDAPRVDQEAHASRVTALAFSPDGELLASAGRDGCWRLWWVREGRELHSFGEEDPGGTQLDVGFAGDGRRLITVAREAAELWDFGRARRYASLDAAAAEARVRLQTAPDDPRALITLGEHYAFRGSLRTAVELLDRAAQAGGAPDPLLLARAHWELGTFGHARLALRDVPEPETQAARARLTLWRQALDRLDGERGGRLGQERWFVRQVEFSPDGRFLASSGSSGTVDLWSVRTGLLRVRLRERPGDVFSLAFSADGRRLLSCDENGLVLVWDPETLATLAQVECERRVTGAVVLNDGRFLTSDHRHGVALWSAAGELLEQLPSELKRAGGLALSADERWLAVSGADGMVELWDRDRGELARRWQADERGYLEIAGFSPDGQRLLTGGYDKTLRVWRLGDGAEQARFETEGALYGVDAGDDVFAAGVNNEVRVWDMTSGREVARRQQEGLVFTVAVSPDGRWLAAGTRNGELMLTLLPR